MPQAMAALLDDPQLQVDGFICPGHVSIITGARIYEFICRDYHRPCVVAGFEPADLAEAILRLIQQHAEKRADVEIQYRRSVTRAGNQAAQTLLNTVFEPCDEEWRGVGLIPGSGLRIRREFADYDAGQRFSTLQVPPSAEPKGCRCGDVLRGAITPPQCPLFRTRCTPASPIGACMVSSEGTCAAYHRYSDLGAQG
jgi:hydrogenase expression/formation protein HypD